jgi:hypothetical protein
MGAERREPMVDRILPLLEPRRAHELSQGGHTRGKIVLTSQERSRNLRKETVMIAKTKYHSIAEWDFSLWFALLSPLIGILFGILGGFLLYH